MTAEKMFNELGWKKSLNKCKTVLDYTKVIDEDLEYEDSIVIDLEDKVVGFYSHRDYPDTEVHLDENEIKAFCKLMQELGISE